MRGAQGEAADPVERGLDGHHREAAEAGDGCVAGEAREGCGRFLTGHEVRSHASAEAVEQREDRTSAEIQAPHGVEHTVQAEQRHEEEAPGQSAREGPERVEAVHPRVDARGVLEVSGEGQREDRDGSAHEHRRRPDQPDREQDVEGEAQAGVERNE